MTQSLDCLFIYTPKFKNYGCLAAAGEEIHGLFLPMGLLAIADFIERHGQRTKIIHLGIEWIKDRHFSLRGYLEKTQPRTVAMPLHWDLQAYDAMRVAKAVKDVNSNVNIILGGFTASFFDLEIMENFKEIDAIIRGDGEKPLLAFLNKSESKDYSSVPNLTWRQKNKIIRNSLTYVADKNDLDSFNFANLSLLENHSLYVRYTNYANWNWFKDLPKLINKRRTFEKPVFFPLPLGRGCAADCSHCGGGSAAQKIINNRQGFILRSPNKIIDSIKEAKKYGYKGIFVYVYPEAGRRNAKYLVEIFEKIKQENIDIGCFMECPDLPNEELIAKFKETFGNHRHSGIRIFINSASEELRRLNKGYSFPNESVLNTLSFIQRLKIDTELYFLLDLPYNKIEYFWETIRLQQSLRKNFKCISKIYNFPIQMQPASLVYLFPSRFGVVGKLKSFLDFYKFHRDSSKENFFKLGYSLPDFFDGCRIYSNKVKNKEDDFEVKLQKLRCRYACNLVEYAPILRWGTQKIICNMLGFLWSLKHKEGVDIVN